MNDLPLSIQNCNIDIFADDATLYKSSKGIESINSNLQVDVKMYSNGVSKKVWSWMKQKLSEDNKVRRKATKFK